MTDFNTTLQQLEAKLQQYLTFCEKNKAHLDKGEISKAAKRASLLEVLPSEKDSVTSTSSNAETQAQKGSFAETFAEKMIQFRKEFEAIKLKIEGNVELKELFPNSKNN